MTLDEMMDDFWDNHLPKGMKSQGRPKTREALEKALKVASYATICAGLRPYVKHKPHDQQYCMASVYLNQQRWTAEYDEPTIEKPYEQRRRESELYNYVTTGKWRGAVNVQPTIEEARAKLHREGWKDMEPILSIVPTARMRK